MTAQYFIGGTASPLGSQSFFWADGSPIRNTFWDIGEPTVDFGESDMMVTEHNWKWHNVNAPPTHLAQSVCKRESWP